MAWASLHRLHSSIQVIPNIFNLAVYAVTCLLLTASVGLAASAYDFTFQRINGKPLPLSRFHGQPIVLVNTTSQCGFTPQYAEIQQLWQLYRDRGLIVLGVPSNDFGRQEPGTDTDIKRFCEVNFGVDFPLTTKQHVVGDDAHPLYRWIADEQSSAGAPGWNFHKYLIDSDGFVSGSWPSRVSPLSLEITSAIEAVLSQ